MSQKTNRRCLGEEHTLTERKQITFYKEEKYSIWGK